MKILDGKKVAKEIHDEIKSAIEHVKGRAPCLAAVLTTDHPASHTYVRRKVKACNEVGITSKVIQIAPQTTDDLLDLVDDLNRDADVDGILIQLPLPPHIDVMQVLERVDPRKDVDGFHPTNIGKILLSDPTAFYPCTPIGIKTLLQKSEIDVENMCIQI